jgi:hypothetical protein
MAAWPGTVTRDRLRRPPARGRRVRLSDRAVTVSGIILVALMTRMIMAAAIMMTHDDSIRVTGKGLRPTVTRREPGGRHRDRHRESQPERHGPDSARNRPGRAGVLARRPPRLRHRRPAGTTVPGPASAASQGRPGARRAVINRSIKLLLFYYY